MSLDKSFLAVLILSTILLKGCIEYHDHEKFRRPGWLEGKLYTQIIAEDDLAEFAECLRIVGLDTILDVSGSWTVFAPSDEAIGQFLAENQYGAVSDIPVKELEEIVEFHIVQNPWTFLQLQTLNIEGWVDPAEPWEGPNAYKRQTIVKNPNEKYWINRANNREIIMMDSSSAEDYMMVYVSSRKFVPIFFDDMFQYTGLTHEDYSFYFNRTYQPGNVHYAEALVIRPDIFAENGFIHVIDRVVEPMLNGKEMLERELTGEGYKEFLKLVYRYYPEFEYNQTATENQPGFKRGEFVDTLFDLSYPDLRFNIHSEIYGDIGSENKYTRAYHNGMLVPTDEAFEVFVNGILTRESGFPHWTDLESVPEDIIHLIVDHHFFDSPIYSEMIAGGFRDGQRNRYYVNEEDIIRKEFGSNCTFLGVKSYNVPKIFTSVAGPVFLRPGFSRFRYAIEYTGFERRLSRSWGNYSFFPIANSDLAKEESLIMQWIDRDQNEYTFRAFNRFSETMVDLGYSELSDRIRNQVGLSIPDGSANKEFIETLGGNFIIWNNADSTVSGSKPTTFGYEGREVITCNPVLLEEPTDNGKTWRVNSWFNFVDREMFEALAGYPSFFTLLDQAGMYDPARYEFPFLEDSERYTLFMPSEQALIDCRADTLSKKDLANFLKYHVIEGYLIFTDNKMWSGEYETMGRKPGITPHFTYPADIDLQLGPDIIEVLNSTGNPYVTIPENPGRTNKMVTRDGRVSAVIHEIDRVLVIQ